MPLFFLGEDILQCLGGEGLDDFLGRDLDGGAGLGVAADARLAGSNLDGDKAGEGELVSLFDRLGGQFGKLGQDHSGLLFGGADFFCQVGDDLSFGHGHGEVDPFVKTNNWVVYVTVWGL
jgi:hypothetical protein